MGDITDPANIVDAATFDEWLEAMHPRLYHFVDFRRPDTVPGDFSRESLAALEAHLLERYPDPDAYRNDPDRDFLDGAVRYVGETYLRAFGGGWHHSDDPKVAVRYTPYLLLGTPDANAIAPYYLMSAVVHRRTGQVLVKVYDGQQQAIEERQAVDPSFTTQRESVPGLFTSDADQEKLRADARPVLDSWLSDLEPRVESWRAGLDPAHAARLDGTPDSLPAVEELLLDRFATVEETENPEHTGFVDDAARYLGSVFLRAAGGEWSHVPDDPSSLFMGRPYLKRRDSKGDMQYSSPFRAIRTTVKKRYPGVLTKVFHKYAD